MSVPAIAFVGHHNAGKTTLAEQVIARLADEGLRVGSIKHHGANDRLLDLPDSDILHHAHAGSVHSLMVSPTAVASYCKVENEPAFDEVIAQLTDVDVVVVEGYKHAGIPSIAVARSTVDSFGTLRTLLSSSTVAVACDGALAAIVPDVIPTCDINDINGIYALVRKVLGL